MTKLPKGWKLERLDRLAEIQTGIAKGAQKEKLVVSLPYLRVANVQDGHVDLTEMKVIEVPVRKVDRYRLRHGDLLMTEGGDFDKLGRGCIWEGQIEPCVHQNHVFAVRVTSAELCNDFLAKLTASPWGRRYFLGCSKQSTNLASINTSQLKAFPVLVPPLPEQKKIAAILGAWDRAIEKLQALVMAKTERLRALRQQLLTGTRRFPEFRKERWTHVYLADVAENVSERNEGQFGDDRLYAVTKAEGMVPMRERVKGESHERCKIVAPDWFAYNPMRLNIGSISRWREKQPVMVSADYVVFHCHEAKLMPDFLDHVRHSARWNSFVKSAGNGSVRVRIYFDDLGRFTFPLPSLQEQQRIVVVLNACDREIHLLESELEALKQQKRDLMQKLLTGEMRVKSPAR
jgi:type I restriction enzyme S subunit